MKKVVRAYNIVITLLLALSIFLSLVPYSFHKYYNIEHTQQGYQKTDIHNIKSTICNSSTLGLIFFILVCLLFVWMLTRLIWFKNKNQDLCSNSTTFNFVCVCSNFLGLLSSILAFIQVENKEYVNFYGKSFTFCKYHLVSYENLGKVFLISLIVICLLSILYSFCSLIINSSSE